MTSTNDGKDVKSNQTSAPKGKSHYIELYKSLEARLSEVSDSSERTKHLCEAWSQVHSLCLHSAQSTQLHLLSWLQRHTARTILQTEWPTPKRKEDRARLESAINGFISQCVEAGKERDALPWETQLSARGDWFKKVLDRPWDHPVLSVLLNPNGTPPTDDEVLEWLKEERGVTFVMRLHALVGEKCEDIAVSLASAIMERVRSSALVTPDVLQHDETKDKPKASPVSSFGDKLTAEADFTADVWELLTDIEFVLLHKRDSSRCISLAKQTPLRTAYQLVERLQSRLELSPREKRLWKNAKDVAVLIAQVVIARCMVVPECVGVARAALYCCGKSLARALGGRLAPAAAALAAPAASAKHLHTLAQAVDAHNAQHKDTKMKPFVCELYVRAITAGMNELERLKLKTEKESEARQMEKTLCQWFLQLGNVLNASDRIMCECTLTAFSVHPSVQMYEKIKEAPLLPNIVEQIEPKLETTSEYGSWASDSRSQTNFVKTSETLNMKAQQQANVLSTAIFNEGEALGLSPELCQDIAVLLSGPRVKTLTWDMDREQLIEHCRIYMERTHGGTRALTTELKFLNLDPQQFLHLPEEEDDEDDIYYGIEKGYEHLVPLPDPEEFWHDNNDPERTESAHSIEEFVIPHRKKKSKLLVVSSDDEVDPLSLDPENKRSEKKKERPHSKERSKERNKKEPIDQLKIKDPEEKKDKSKHKTDKDKCDKEKKERKKKKKTLKAESLANLVGIKVSNKANKDRAKDATVLSLGNVMSSISDSDYDSQGKSSMTSMNSVESSDVLFDGLFSMDELKSPERPSQSDSMGLMKDYEMSVSNGKVGVHHPSQSKHHGHQKSMAMELLNHPRLKSVSEEVKTRLYKLIDSNRQRAAMEQTNKSQLSPHSSQSNFDNAKDYSIRQNPPKILNNTFLSSESKLENALSRPKIPMQISPKGVAIPDIPKSIINKYHNEKINQLKKEIDILLASRKQPSVNSSIQSPVIHYAKKIFDDPRLAFQPKPPGSMQHQNSIRMKDLVTVGQERYGPYEVTKPVFAQSRPSLPVHRPPITETPGENSYKKFLAEFQRSVDSSPMTPHTSKREIKPVSRVTPVIPNVIKPDPPQRAKPTQQQKKPDNSLNTFSRLSYMHKNKQADIKNRAIEASQSLNAPRQTLGSKIDDFVLEHLRKSSHQSSTYNTPQKLSNEYAQSVKKSEMTGRPGSHNTILSQIFGHTDTKTIANSTCERVNTQKSVIKTNSLTPPKNYLSEQDQADIVKLLRQRSTLNVPEYQSLKQQINSTAASTSSSDPSDKSTIPTKTQSNKVINILSTTIIKPPSKASAANTKPTIIYKKGGKGEIIEKPKKSECKLDTKKNTEPDSEWQSVCAALLAQKTPTRGPNALDVALNKSSFEKAFEDSLRNNPNVFMVDKCKDTQLSKENTSKVQDAFIKSDTDSKNVKSKAITRKDCNAVSKPTKDLAITKSNEVKNVVQKKSLIVESPKKCLNENLKKKITYVKAADDDPFISGIPNSDYDLIEELMDDDLRKEIGELSSDEETYSQAPANLVKSAKPNDKRLTATYDKPLDTRPQPVKPIEGHHQTLKQGDCVRKPAVKCVYENKAVQIQSKSETIPICHKTVDTCSKIITAPNVAHQNPQIHGYNNASTYANNNLSNSSNMYVSAAPQPPAQNVVLIGSNIVYEGYSTVQTPIHTVTNTAYVVNSVPNITLYQPTQYVQPVINQVIIENTVPAPLITSVQYSSIPIETNTVSNLINEELIQQNINNSIQASRPMNIPQHGNKYYDTLATKESRSNDKSGVTIQQTSQYHPGTSTRPGNLKVPTMVLNNNPPKTYSAPVHPKISKLSGHMMTESSVINEKHDEAKCNTPIVNKALDNQSNHDIMTNPEFKVNTLTEHTKLIENHSKQDCKISDIIFNKNIERKVLSEVQEKQILTQEKQVLPEVPETKVKYQNIDYEKPLKTCQDQERLKNKRMAIINRKISHYSEETPIPLSYSPLSPVIQGTAYESESEIKTANSQLKTTNQKTENVKSITQGTKDNCKENKSDATPCRRILLRSSNKLQNKGASDLKLTPKKVTKKATQSEKLNPKVIDQTITQKDLVKPGTSKRESKRIRNIVLNKNEQPGKQKTRKVKLNVGRKAPLKIKNNKKGLRNVVKETNTVNAIDIEAELIGSRIPKVQLSEHIIDNFEIISYESSKDEVMASTLTEIDNDEQKLPSDLSDSDIKELSAKTVAIPAESETVHDFTLSVPIDNEVKEHPTYPTIHEERKKSELAVDIVPKPMTEIQGSDITQLPVQNKEKTIDEICDEKMPAINLETNATQKSCYLFADQENGKTDKANPNENGIYLENQNNVHYLEKISKTLDTKEESTVLPDDNDKYKKIQNNTEIRHNSGDKDNINSMNNTDTEKPSTDLSEILHDNNLPSRSVRSIDKDAEIIDDSEKNKIPKSNEKSCTDLSDIIHDDKLPSQVTNIKENVEITDATEKLKDPKSNEKSSTDESEIIYDIKLPSPSVINIDDDVEIIDNTDKLDPKCNFENLNLSDIPQSYKDSISIEHLPNQSSDNPLEKCFRIKLPNNKVFKATVRDHVDVDFDSLFHQPSIRSVLINNSECKKRCTLNIKQVTTVSRHGQKVLTTRIQDVTPKIKSNEVIDTVVLLSDDEDESQQVFDTEFGKYKIQTIDTDSYNKHREKLKVRPVVVLEKQKMKEVERVENNAAVVNIIEELKSDSKLKKIIQPENNDAEVVESEVSDVVLIDDSSDDDINSKDTPHKGINKLRDNLLKDLGVGITESNSKDETVVLKEKLLMDLGLATESKDIKNKSEVPTEYPVKQISIDIPEIDLTEEDNATVEPKTLTDQNKGFQVQCPWQFIDFTRKCYVKLIRCDELAKMAEANKKKPVKQIMEAKLECPKPRFRSNSFSILDEFTPLCDVDTTYTDLDRSSPVIEVFDFIASNENFVFQKPNTFQSGIRLLDNKEHNDPVVSVSCNADWFDTKKSIHVFSITVVSDSSSPLSVIDSSTKTSLLAELPSLSFLALKYLQDTDVISTLKPIADAKVLKTLKRKLETSHILTTPKISKPNLMVVNNDVCNVSDTTDPDLTDTSITTVLSDEMSTSMQTTDDIRTTINDLLSDCISSVVDSVLDCKNNVSYNIDSNFQEVEYISVSPRVTEYLIEKDLDNMSHNPELETEEGNDTADNYKNQDLISIDADIEQREMNCEMHQHEGGQQHLNTKLSENYSNYVGNNNAMLKSISINPETEDDNLMTENDKMQETISNNPEYDAKDNNENELKNEMGVNYEMQELILNYPKQDTHGDNNIAKSDATQETISNYPKYEAEDSNDMGVNDKMQDLILNNPKQDTEDDNNVAEKYATKGTISNSPVYETGDSSEMGVNGEMQEIILHNPKQDTEDDNNIAEKDETQKTISNNPEYEAEDSNEMGVNDEIKDLIQNNPKQNTEDDNNIAGNDATQETMANSPKYEAEYSNEMALTDEMQELISHKPEHDTEDENDMFENYKHQKFISYNSETKRIEINCEPDQHADRRKEELPLDTNINEYDGTAFADNLAIQESLSKEIEIEPTQLTCERDQFEDKQQGELSLAIKSNEKDFNVMIGNDAKKDLISNINDTKQIEMNCKLGHSEDGQQEDKLLNKINENDPMTQSPAIVAGDMVEGYLNRDIINDCPVDESIHTSLNIENKTSVCELPEFNDDDVKLDLETATNLGKEEIPEKIKNTDIVLSTNESDMTKDNKDLKPGKVSSTESHVTNDCITPDLEEISNLDENISTTVATSVQSPSKYAKTKSEIANDQENSNHGELQWEMSIANDDQTINQPLESNAEQIITKILKLTGKEGSEVVLKGIQCEDPQVGTYYMFPLIEQSDQSDLSEVNIEITNREDIINLIQETSNGNLNETVDTTDNFDIVYPTHTYSRKTENINVQRNLKRKKDMSDVKIQEKRYRKGKNIDYPKFTAASMSDTVYVKEYKRLMEYCSTVKFSYSRPFHKENIEVDNMLRNWPIVKADVNITTDLVDIQEDLFTEIEEKNTRVINPLEQTLAQEITSEYNESNYKPINIIETNFSMGFGERSDRVFFYTKTEKNTSKLSAATLSDVKPYQPYLTSGVNSTETKNMVPEQNDVNVKLRHVRFIELKEKVRSFFQKTAAELLNDVTNDSKKYQDNDNFPFGLTSTEFLTEIPQEILVNVVQVGQLPVSAAAQNPVTCDPRVTHVTNVSPSQCSADNSPGDDNQTPIKTEYTELTTADITLPLVQEYAHHLQQMSSANCQEPSQTHDTDSNDCSSTEVTAQIKIELTEENSQERQESEGVYEQLTTSSDNNNINGVYNYHESPNSTTPDSVSHGQIINNAILNTMNDHSSNNNTTLHTLNGHNFNNPTIGNAMNGQNLNTIIKEEIDEFGPDNTILENVMNGHHIDTTTVQGTINSQINNNLPVDDAMNTHVQNNTTVEQPTNDQNLDNTIAEVTMNGTTMNGGMNDQNANNTSVQVAMNGQSLNNTIPDNSLNGHGPNNSNLEDPKNIQSFNSAVDEAIASQNASDAVAGETIIAQSTVDEPKDLNTFSDMNCDQQIEKTDQLAHAMNAAGITTSNDGINTSDADALVDIISQNAQSDVVSTTQMTANNFAKSTPINAMALQQALAQILPPPLNQTTVSDNSQTTTNAPPVLHIVQGSNSQTVINKQNGTPILHIVQNKTASNGVPSSQANSFSGLSLVDTGLQQGGNQLLHIVNTGNQKNNNTGQLLKRVNLLTNIANAQGGNEQKMVQFVCKSADGKSIQLNAPHQRSMVLRLQPIDPSTLQAAPKPTESQDVSPNTGNSLNNKDASQQDIKSRSVYEENYAKFIQNGTDKPGQEKSTSLPKFNQVFGKQVYQENKNEMNSDGLSEHGDGQQSDNNIHLDGINDINSPPLLLRKSTSQTSQAQSNLVQQIKQTIAPMNIQTMHGGVIYTRQIPVNIGGGQTINLITVPSTELVDDSNQKQQSDGKFIHQEGDHVIKIVPQSQINNVSNDENNAHVTGSNEAPQNPQPQPVLTQMRIKLPMLSKAPHMVSGARVVRPSFFQIQRNVIGGANQPVYQQLVLTTAPSLGQTIRVPAQTRPAKPPESQSSPESQMSSSTLEQLREFDMVLEQVKERSTVNPGSSHSFSRHSSADTTDSSSVRSKSVTETTQVMYTTENNQTITSYVNRKSTVTSASTSSFVRSPDSSGIVESPSSSTQNHIPHTSTSESTSSETPPQPKPKKKKKSSVSSSNPAMKMPAATPKPSSQKPLEDEQTTQRILYILAEYKEQVENSPDKDKPAPRRRNNLPPNLGKRKKSSSGSRRRDMSPIHGEDSCRTMGSEDSSCGTSLSECAECMESHSPQESPRKVVRKLSFEQESPQITSQPRTTTIPQRNVIVADGQTITVARGTAGKPATTVLMPANYLLPVSMVKGGQQIAIVTNRGPKLLVGSGEGGTGGTLLLQRLIGPAGLKPVLTRPGVRHIRLPTAALHNLQAFNIATHAATTQPADSTASPVSAPAPPDLVDTRAMSSPWPDREAQEARPDRGSSPEGSEPWNLPSSSIADDYGYEEIVRTDNMDRTVLDAIPDRYSPDMEAQRIFDKMFDVDSKKSMYDTRCGFDIDASDTDDRPYQVVQRRDGRHHRLTHVSAAALRHKYAILEHELRLQKSLSEECEDLGVDSPSAAELFPEAELFFAPSPVHEQTIGPCLTPQPTILNQGISQPDLDDQIATDQLLTHHDQELDINLDDVGEIVTVGEDGMATIALDHEEFVRSHPNTTFHTEPEEGEIPPFTISQSIKGRQITFHAGRGSGTVVMGPQTTVISQATVEATGIQNTVKFTDIDNMINAMPSPQQQTNISSVLVKDSGLTRFDSILTDSRELHLSNTASAIVHSTGQGTQVIRRVRYDDRREPRYLVDDPDAIMAEKIDDNRDSESIPGDDTSSPERHPELFWESNSASERSDGRRRVDFSSDSDKCCKSPFDEASTDSSFGNHTRLDSVIKAARTERSGSGSSDDHPPLRTYPAKRVHVHHHDAERSLSGKTRAGESCLDVEGRRRASNRGVVKRGCHCCSGSSPAPPKPKKPRQKKPSTDFTNP